MMKSISKYGGIADCYRFGFNGMEQDNEVSGGGNKYTTFYRELDTRLARWMSVDPDAKVKPWESPYVSMGNTPIWHNDQLGNTDDKPRANNKNAEVKEHKKKVESDRKNTPNTPTPPSTPKPPVTPAPTPTPTNTPTPPGVTLKRTNEVIVNPGVKVDAYSTITPTPSPSPLETVFDVNTLKLESTNIKTDIGTFSYGTDGSHTFGNSIISTGTSASGNLILDISIPTGKNTALGTTLLINTNALKSNMEYFMEGVHQGLSKPIPLFIPLPTAVPLLLPIVP